MKKIFSFLTVMTVVLFTASCGKSSVSENSPASIEKSINTQLQKGNYEKAIEIMVDHLDTSDPIGAKEKAEFIKAFAEKSKESYEAKGGIKSFEIVSENFSEDGLTATVESRFTFGDGTEDMQTSKYVKKDGEWKLSIGK